MQAAEDDIEEDGSHIFQSQFEMKSARVRLSSSSFNLPVPILRVGGQTVFTRGRPPWYTMDGNPSLSFVIGICGGSGSGKTTVAQKIIERLNVPWVSLLSMDSYYKALLTPAEKELIKAKLYDFDHPNAIDCELLITHLRRLRDGKNIQVPQYDFTTHSRTNKMQTIYGADIVICEGIHTFYWSSLQELMDLKIFVDTDADERLSRRIIRDIKMRGRELRDIIQQYTANVKPAYDQYIAPTMGTADIIIPRGGENHVAIDIIVRHLEKRLQERNHHLRPSLVNGLCFEGSLIRNGDSDCLVSPWGDTVGEKGAFSRQMPPQLHILPMRPQAHCMHTLLRDRETNQDSFIFYSDRLMRPLCEFAYRLLPFEDVTVETPQGVPYTGRRLARNTQVCGVSILRAGEAFEDSLCAVCKDVRLGKILIQTNPITKEPELHYLRLPSDIRDCHVILMDSTVASGAAAIMAMRVLVEHDVPEDHIILVSLIMAVQGVHSVAYTYPSAHIVTSAIDPELSEHYHILPGIGNFGDRYFGTTP